MNAFERSWEVTKASWAVLVQDKELLLFPIFSVIFSGLFIVLMLFPVVILSILHEVTNALTLPLYLTLFLLYFGVAFIATFFNVCVVYTTKTRFEGKNATLSESISFALSKSHLIFYWSLVAATVGLIIRILENNARRGNNFMARIIVGMIGAAWSIATMFVVPSLVYHGYGPREAIEKSVQTIRKTWGENLIAFFGFGFAQFAFILIGAAVFVPLFILSLVGGWMSIGLVVLLAVLYVVGVALVFGILKSIFHTALFVYAEKGKIPLGYKKEMLKTAFVKKASL